MKPAHVDFELLRFVWQVLVTVASAAGAFAWLYLTRHFVRRGEIGDLAEALQERDRRQDDRITVLEQRVNHGPSHSDMEGLRRDLAGLRAELSALRGEQASQNQLLARIHAHLLNSGD